MHLGIHPFSMAKSSTLRVPVPTDLAAAVEDVAEAAQHAGQSTRLTTWRGRHTAVTVRGRVVSIARLHMLPLVHTYQRTGSDWGLRVQKACLYTCVQTKLPNVSKTFVAASYKWTGRFWCHGVFHSPVFLGNIPRIKVDTQTKVFPNTLKACTHRPIFRGLAAESAVSKSADSIPDWANSTTDSVIVGRLFLLNILNILNPLESAIYWSQPTSNWPSGYGALRRTPPPRPHTQTPPIPKPYLVRWMLTGLVWLHETGTVPARIHKTHWRKVSCPLHSPLQQR